MKKIIFTILSFILTINIINAEETIRFKEGKTLESTGFYTNCTKPENHITYCLSLSINPNETRIYKVDIENETSTLVYESSLNETITSIIKTNKGFLTAYNNANGTGYYISFFDKDLNLLKTLNTTVGGIGYSGITFTKVDNNYYFIGSKANASQAIIYKINEEELNVESININDLTDSKYDYIKAFNIANSTLTSPFDSITNLHKTKNGYLAEIYLSSTGKGTLSYFENNEVKWTLKDEGTFGNVIIKDDYFYVAYELTSEKETYLKKYDYNGEELNNIPINIINNERIIIGNYISNFTINDNGKTYFVSYNPGTNNIITEWKSMRLISINIKNNITVNNEDNGEYSLNLEEAFEGDIITINTVPKAGYEIESITITDENNNIIELKDNKFTMPDTKVTIDIKYKEIKNEEKESKEEPIINPFTKDIILILILVLLVSGTTIKIINKKKSSLN